MSKAIDFLINEWKSYSRNIQITIYVLLGFTALFAIFGIQILFWGLGYTNMNNIFNMGLWILGDLGYVALGGGAFFTGFMLYIFRVDKLQPLINSTVLIGFMCYLFTFVLLVFEIGQPLRAWFGYTYPNWGSGLLPTSMLTEVIWCLTFYFMVLIIELFPIILSHKVLDRIPALHYIAHYLHKLMWIMAAVGTFLSFFHQGSLGGGMWDIMYAKAAWFRPNHLYFFVAIVAATAGGTCLMMVIPKIAQWVQKKELIPKDSFMKLAQISGAMFIFYFLIRVFDIYTQWTTALPLFDRSFTDIMSGSMYGWWVLVLEFAFTISAVVILNMKKFRENDRIFTAGIISGVMAIIMMKFRVIMHGYSVPNFPWKPYMTYGPSIQEWALMLGSLAIMVLIYMWFAKYIPMFIQDEEHSDVQHSQ